MKLAILGVTIIMMVGFMGYAQKMGPMCEEKECDMMCHEDIGLTPEQKAKIEDININTRKTVIPFRSQIELRQIDMEKEMKAEKPNKDKILKIAQEIHELEWQIKKTHLEKKFSIASLLTPEQRAKMKMMHGKKMMKKIEIKREIKD